MTDRDQVAREVLTEAIEHMAGRDAVVAAHELTKLRDARYPAPAAPVTVTVEGTTYVREVDGWSVVRSDGRKIMWCGPLSDGAALLDRIASDARRIEELERECDRLQSFITVAHSERDTAWSERDEARRLYRESEAARALANDNTRLWRERVTTGLGASTTEEGHVERSSTSAPAQQSPSPAPIPLGAQRRWLLVVDADGIAHECAEANEMEQALRDLQDVERTYHEKGRVVPVIEAVADAATVERVESEIANAFADCMGVMGVTPADMDPTRKRAYARAALRALGIQEVGQ